MSPPSLSETNKVTDPTFRQSIMGWCFKPMDALTLARHAKRIGYSALEGIDRSAYPEVRKMGLEISLVSSHGFRQGPVNPENHAMVEAKLVEAIDVAVQNGAPNVITFTGMREKGIQDETATANCLRCWKRVLPYAESKGITLVLEHLNSVDDSHPMKGHPGYFGDDVHRCVDMVRSMDSRNFRLLFDIYHVQVMHGDLIRHIRLYHDFVGHYHTAGNPGRGELDETQEINYPAVITEIRRTGFDGFLAQEFIPTAENPMASLKHAFQICQG
ncbi:TIM barrel protein [Crateriforma spongiae]|uniref:TIM barrel protein n=1 Tax=Crateriforma spongiae TaxID=2724528 RepID=UPI001F1F2E6C|nr:TIM barrel protein [Crateriforma spongiae]